jgi:hypothetical protein
MSKECREYTLAFRGAPLRSIRVTIEDERPLSAYALNEAFNAAAKSFVTNVGAILHSRTVPLPTEEADTADAPLPTP